jgi:hypothetical protein
MDYSCIFNSIMSKCETEQEKGMVVESFTKFLSLVEDITAEEARVRTECLLDRRKECAGQTRRQYPDKDSELHRAY